MSAGDHDMPSLPARTDTNVSLAALQERYDAQLAAQVALIAELRRRADAAERRDVNDESDASSSVDDAGADTEARTGRIEAFSDGVFSIAITLLVLDLHVPGTDEIAARGIWATLADRWPNYLGFLLSFLLIGQVWANHRTMFGFIRRADPTLVVLNTLLLLNIAVLPFCTALLAASVTHLHERQAALLIYTGALALGGVVYNALWWHAAHERRLIVPRLSPHTVRILSRNYLLGPVLYTVAFALAFVNGFISLALCVALILLYLTPGFVHRFRRPD